MEIIYKTIERFPNYKFGSDGSVWSCNKPHPDMKISDKQGQEIKNKFKPFIYTQKC